MSSSPDILAQALEWQVTLWSGEATQSEHDAFEQWLSSDARHHAIWEQLQQTNSTLSVLRKPGAGPALRTARQSNARRNTLRAITCALGIGVLLQSARQTAQWQHAMADYRTAAGERRTITLPDGTQLVLNTATAIDVVFDNDRRKVKVLHGEIQVTTAPDNQFSGVSRPFLVETSEGMVRPIGTRFVVRQEDDHSRVAVLEGSVEITPRDSLRAPLRLQAGQQTSFTSHVIVPAEKLSTTNTAWIRGLLVAERMRLDDFLAELGRYRRGSLRCDPAVADMLVSGVYSTEDTDQTLASLADVLPVRIQYISRFWVTVQPRQS